MRRPKSLLLWLLIIAVVAAFGGGLREWQSQRRAPPQPTGEPMTGRARVVDGDSLEIAGHRIRLFGIDAPEGRQDCRDARGRDYACGRDARRAQEAAIGGRPVTCTPVGESYDREVSICTVEGRDLSEAMVRTGHALELRNHSRGRYSTAECEAREARRGLWAGDFERPSDWRHETAR